MKIAIIGAGNIGGTLGAKWTSKGHQVVFGARNPQSEKIADLLNDQAHGASAVHLSQLSQEVDVVLFAVPGRAMEETLVTLGNWLNGKILIDATNVISRSIMDSLSILQATAPDSRLFRAFSNLGWEVFGQPEFKGIVCDLFYCGSGDESRLIVEHLIEDIGLRPVYLGGLEKSEILDALTRLYFTLARDQGYGRHVGLKMLT